MEKTHLLIVEDERIVAMDVKQILETLGYTVPAIVSSGERAVEKAAEIQPDLVLMDIRLRGEMDGVQAAEQIRMHFDIPIVYLTAYADDETLRRARITEPFGYILKPFEERELHSVIQMALYKHQMESKLKEREEYYRSLIENSSDIIMVLNADGSLRYASPSIARVSGYVPEEIIGKGLFTLLHPDDSPSARDNFVQLCQNAAMLWTGEWRFHHKDASWRFLEIIGQNQLDDPVVKGVVINARDITKRRLMERTLRESEQKFRTLADQSPNMIFINQGGRIVYVNERCAETMGYTQDEFAAPTFDFLTFIAPEYRELVKRNFSKHVRGEEIGPCEYTLVTKDGASLDAIINTRLINYGGDRAILGVVTDITERKKTERALKSYTEQLQALEEAAAVVSSTLDADLVLDRILDQVERVVAGDAFDIMLTEEDEARVVRCRGYERLGMGDTMSTFSIPVAEYPNLANMAQTGKSILKPDTGDAADWVPMDGEEWLSSYVAAPIQVMGETRGFLNVSGTRQGQFTPADARLLEAFASHAAVAIENAQLHQDLRQYAERLEDRVQERTAQLWSQYARLKAILESTSDGIVVTNSNGQILQINPVAQTWLTRTLLPKDAKVLREIVQELAAQAKTRPTRELELREMDLKLSAVPISEQVEKAMALVTVHDISDLKQIDRMKSHFVANVSHELRTPVTTIKLYAHLMQKTSPENRVWKKYLRLLAQEADNQAQLVEDVLQLSRIDAGWLALEPCPTSLADLINVVMTSRQILAQEQKVTLECYLIESEPVVMVDPKYMRQVLNNLVCNAIQYTPAGGKVLVSTGKAEMNGQVWATAIVKDTGVGIPEKELPYIFDRFFRGELAQSEQIPGTGLGLSIAKKIIELHGGKMTVDSKPNVGSTFTVWLPVAG